MKLLPKLFVAYLIGVFLVVASAGVASAAIDDGTPVGPDSTQAESVFNLAPFTVTIIIGFLIPVINGIITKASTSSGVKAVVTLVLSAVAGVINVSLVDGGGAIISESTLAASALTLVMAIASYYGVWKPLDVTSSPVSKVQSDGTLVTQPGKLADVGVT